MRKPLSAKGNADEIARISSVIGDIAFDGPGGEFQRVQDECKANHESFIKILLGHYERAALAILKKYGYGRGDAVYILRSCEDNIDLCNAADVLCQLEYLEANIENGNLEGALAGMARITAASIKAEFASMLFDGLRTQVGRTTGGRRSKKLRGIELFVVELLREHAALNERIIKQKLRGKTEEYPWTAEDDGVEYEIFLDSGGKVQHKAIPPSGKVKRKDILIGTILSNYYLNLKKNMT